MARQLSIIKDGPWIHIVDELNSNEEWIRITRGQARWLISQLTMEVQAGEMIDKCIKETDSESKFGWGAEEERRNNARRK